MPLLKVNDISLYYEMHGKGKPLVFLGGLANDLTDYTKRTKIIDLLAKHFTLIMVDNRGSGRSDKPHTPYSIEMMADDAAGLIKALHIQRAHILGISMGGRIALDLAIRYPQLIDKLILVSTAARVIPTLKRFFVLGIFSTMPVTMTKYPQPKYAFSLQKKASSNYNGSDKLNLVTAPTLILHGKKDGLAPYKLAAELHRGIKNSQIVTFDGGHMFMLPRQKAFADTVIHFLHSSNSL